MHPITEVGTNVSAFLAKLWRMVEDPETNDLICWNSDGTSFMIKNQSQFAKELLPMYYKHNNMASFIRQLNMYGFHKVVSAENNGLRLSDNDEISFSHHCFIRGHPYLLEHIKRKMTVTKENNEIRAAPDIMNKMLNDVKSMKGRQESLDSKLSSMKQENEALWRELSILRQKHAKQQTIVNKLIQFLVTLVHPTRNLSVKRRSNFPLMLREKAHNGHKHSYLSEAKRRTHYNSGSSDSTNPSPTGPTIHELDPSDFLESVNILETNKLRSDSPLSPTITDCDSAEGDVLVDSPSITSKLRNNLDDGTLLDLVTEAVSPAEELVTVPPEAVNPAICVFNKNALADSANMVDSNLRQQVRRVAAKVIEEKKAQPLTFKSTTVPVDQKMMKRVSRGRAKKSESPPRIAVDSTLKSMLTKPKPKMPQPAQRTGLKVKMPVRQATVETAKLPSQNLKRPSSNGSAVTPSPKSQKMEEDSLSQPDVLLLTNGGSRIKNDGLISPPVSVTGSLPLDVNTTSPVGIVTMPSPSNSELQQIFDQSPLSDNILGMPDNFPSSSFSMPDNTVPVSGEAADTQAVMSMSPTDILNSVPSTSPVERNINDMALTLSSPAQLAANGTDLNSFNRSGHSTDFSNHVETMQNDLDCLKDLLQKEGLSLDANVLMGLFNNEDSMSFNPPAYQNPITQTDQTDMSQSYNQLTTYNPSNLDLVDVFQNSEWSVPTITEQTNEDEDLFKDLNTPIISIPNSPPVSPLPPTPLPATPSAKRRRK
nr:PREDICTED: heat shock factor protein isoform X2 [Bemisia tabaci]